MRLLLLAPLLTGCAFLTPARTVPDAPTSLAVTEPGPLTASVEVAGARPDRPLPVVFTLRNVGRAAVELEYSAQVNYGTCGYPPYVALQSENGRAVRAPVTAERLTCSQVRLSRTLPPGEVLVLRRNLPNPGAGTFTLSAWFDGLVDGRPNRTLAPDTIVTVRP